MCSWSGCWNIFKALNNCLNAAPAAAKGTALPLQGPADDCPYQVTCHSGPAKSVSAVHVRAGAKEGIAAVHEMFSRHAQKMQGHCIPWHCASMHASVLAFALHTCTKDMEGHRTLWHLHAFCTCGMCAQVPRRALLVLALCTEAGRYGLLLPLLSEEAGSPSLVQRLVILVDDVTRSPPGELSKCLHNNNWHTVSHVKQMR